MDLLHDLENGISTSGYGGVVGALMVAVTLLFSVTPPTGPGATVEISSPAGSPIERSCRLGACWGDG